jgi:hypothetical protein
METADSSLLLQHLNAQLRWLNPQKNLPGEIEDCGAQRTNDVRHRMALEKPMELRRRSLPKNCHAVNASVANPRGPLPGVTHTPVTKAESLPNDSAVQQPVRCGKKIDGTTQLVFQYFAGRSEFTLDSPLIQGRKNYVRVSMRVKCHSQFLHFPYLFPVQITWFANVGRIEKKVRTEASLQEQRKRLLVIRAATIIKCDPGQSILPDTIWRFRNVAY